MGTQSKINLVNGVTPKIIVLFRLSFLIKGTQRVACPNPQSNGAINMILFLYTIEQLKLIKIN